jgi:hypothetical protein
MKTKMLLVKLGGAKEEFHWLTRFEDEVSDDARNTWYTQLEMRLKERNVRVPEDVQQCLQGGFKCWELSCLLFAHAAKAVTEYSDKTKLRAELSEVEAQLRAFKSIIAKGAK